MIETDPFAGPRPDNPLKTDDESASMSFDMGLDGLEPADANVTEVAKTYETPNDDHVGYLRSNPDLIDDFDMKFGPGAGARHLGQDPKPPPLPETPTIDTGYILESMRDDPDPFPQLDEVLDDQAALNIQRRDTAILKSMVRARQEPDRLEAGWVDQEISSALKNYQRLVGKAGVMGPFTPGIDSAIKVADQRLSMAMDLQTKVPGYAYRQLSRAEAQAQKANKALEDATRAGKVTPDIEARALVSRRVAQEAAKISVDLERNVPRIMAPQVRLRVAEKIGEQEAVIKALEAERDAARSNPDFTEDMVDVSRTRQIVSEPGDIGIVGDEAIPSVREETYTEQIPRYDYEIMQAKGKLAQLKQAYREGMTAPAVEGASFVGEAQRSFRRALFGQFPELMGGAITQWGESLESPLVQSLGEGMRSQGIADQQSLPAEANPTLDSIRAWNIGDVSRYVGSKLGQSFGYAAPIMATYMASIPAGIGVGMAMGQGEVRNALEQEFALLGIEPDPKKMATYVYMAGSAVGLIDSAAAAFHLNTLTGTAKQAAKASFLRALAVGVANNAAVEGITEGVQETILALVESHATNLGIDRDEYVKRLMESVAAGAIGGAGFGAAGSLRQYAMDLEREEFERLVKGEAEKIVQELQQEAQKATPETQEGAPRGGRRQAPVEGVATRPVPQETQAPPAAPPQDAASFIRERGGIVDETGDMASFGAPKSIVNNQTGLSPDAMREALVEAGYITETGGDGQAQTTVDDVYEIVRRITAGEKVYPVGAEGEVAAIEGRRPNMRDEEANAILSDLQAQMERDGIPYTLSEREEQAVIKGVRDEGLDPYDAFESAVMQSELNRVGALREGRDQGQRTSIPSEIFPSVGPRSQGGSRAPARAASGRNAGGSGRQAGGGSGAGRITARHLNSFANYLKEGGSLAVRNYKEIAQEVGLEPEQVLDLMREAQAQGIVKPDRRGRMRRGPNLETFRGVDVPDIGAAQRGQSSVGRRRQEFVETLKTENGTWQADKAIVKQMLDEMKPLRGILPEDTYIGVIESAKFDGVYDVDGRYEIHAEMTFRGYGNKKHRVAMTPEQAASTGFFFYVGEDDNMYVLAFTPITGEAATGESLAGGLYHEAVHNLHHTGSFGERFGRLAAHGESLGIFDMTVKEYLTLTKDATASLEAEGGRTIGEAYLELYTKNGIKGAKLENYLQQEAAAIFTELWQHNYWTQAELDPVLDILEDIESGRLARGEMKGIGDGTALASIAGARSRQVDDLGYYSQALEAAKSLRQAKGTPEQMLAMLKKEGARQAELDAAMVPEFLKGKTTVTRDEIVRHLEENRVELKLVQYQDAMDLGEGSAYDAPPDVFSRQTKWSNYSLDPNNPTYRETVLSLGEETVQRKAVMKEIEGQSMTAENVAKLQATEAFRSGHFSEPNIIGHTMSSIVKHEGQTTYLVDQIQSDWGQKLRDVTRKREADVGPLKAELDQVRDLIERMQVEKADEFDQAPFGFERPLKPDAVEIAKSAMRERGIDPDEEYGYINETDYVDYWVSERDRLEAELGQASQSSVPANPLVDSTDQWVNTTLRHVIRDAALEDAKFIAIPSGSTVLSYNPGDDVGMMSFYGQQPNRTAASIMRENGESGRLVEIAEKGTEGIVPKNLRKLLQKLDKNTPPPQVVKKLETPTSGMKGEGFTVFPLTDIVKARVLNEGQALFSLAGGPNLPDSQRRIPKPGPGEAIKPLSEVMDDLIKALGLIRQHGRLNPGLKAQAGKAGGQLLGQHNANTGVTRTAIPMDMETLAHEGGHALEVRFSQTRVQNETLRLIMDRWRNELEPLATMGRDQLSEGFAEFFRRYVTNPSAAENAAPNFMNEFEDFLDAAEPGLRDALEQVQVGYQDWIDAPSGVAVASTIKSSRKPSLVRQWVDKYGLKGFREAASEDFNKVYTGVIDDLNPMNQAVSRLLDIASRNIRTTLGVRQAIGVTAANDPYKLLRLARNAYQRGHMALMRGVIPYMGTDFKGASFRDAMGTAFGGFDAESWSDENRTRFDSYLTSKRMVREWDRFKAGEIARPPDKLSKADHEQNIAELEAQNPSFRQGAERLYEYQGNLLKLAYDAGFMSKDAYETYIQRNDYYVPLNRYFSEDEKLSVDGQSFAEDGSRRLMRQFRGSTRDIISPTESIAKFTYELHYIIARNDAVKALDTLARAAGPGGGQIAERIPNVQVRGMSVDAVEVVKQAGKAQGLDDQDLMFMVKAIEDGLGEDTETTLFTAGEINAAGEPIIFMWEDGKRVPLRLNDPDIGGDMYEAITGLGKEWGGFSLYLASLPTRMLRAGVTLDPAFIGANFARDQFAAWINSDDFTPFVTGVRGTAEAYRANMGQEANDADLLNAMGGIMGGASVAELSETRVKRDIERLRTKGIRFTEGFNFITNRGRLQEVTGITESGTRIGVFRNARQRALNDGLSEYEALIEAAYSANDIIDFGRHGSKMLAVRRLVTFLNASLQGLDRSIRTGIGQTESKVAVRDLVSPYIKHRTGQPLTILERKQVSTAAKFHAKMVSIGLIGAAMSLLYMDDEEYQEIPEYIRDTHWVFKIEDGSWVRFPKPFELAIYSNIAERAIEYGVGGDEAALDRMRRGLFAVLIPPHTVPGVQTGYELWANKSAFSGAPIVNDMLLAYEPEMQFTSYTSEFSKTMAQWTGVSAAKLDHAIMGITGGLGRIALDASNQTFPAIGQGLDAAGLPTMGFSTTPRTAIRQNDIPFIKRFTTDPARSSLSRREFYQQMARTDGEMSMVANSYKERWDRGEYLEATQLLSRRSEQQRAYALLEGHGSAAEKRLHPMNRARDILSTTNSIKRELATGELKRADGTAYSPSDRRTILQMIEQVQMREARNAMVMIGLPGYAQRKILDNEPIWKELQAKAPDLWVELDYRLNKKKIQPMDVIRTEWPALRQRVMAPGYAEQNPPTRASGRRSGYDVDVTP